LQSKFDNIKEDVIAKQKALDDVEKAE